MSYGQNAYERIKKQYDKKLSELRNVKLQNKKLIILLIDSGFTPVEIEKRLEEVK